jgi:hypothetical protein
MIVGARPAAGTEQVRLGIRGYSQPVEQCHHVLIAEREHVDPQQLVAPYGTVADLAQVDLAIVALRVEEDGRRDRPCAG